MARRINAAGLSLIKQWEGHKTTAYKDVAGIWTIGYGHTSAAGAPIVRAGMVIGDKEAERILQNDLAKFEARVEERRALRIKANGHVNSWRREKP